MRQQSECCQLQHTYTVIDPPNRTPRTLLPLYHSKRTSDAREKSSIELETSGAWCLVPKNLFVKLKLLL